jgi:uncharacterized protein (DUF488 family)
VTAQFYKDPPGIVYTVGHGSRTADELLLLLGQSGIARIADVRRYPHSRRHPQHDRKALSEALAGARIEYVWFGEELGGRMPETVPPGRSRNGAWREPAFRRYADAMEGPPFRVALGHLESLAREAPTALLCSERLWWQCHRRLLADLFHVRGWEVRHLLEPDKTMPHELTPWARPEGDTVTYPALL